MGPKAVGDGKLALNFPLGKAELPMVATVDIGKFTSKLFEDQSYIGKIVGVVSSIESMSKVAQVFSKVLGQPVVYNELEASDTAKLGFRGAGNE